MLCALGALTVGAAAGRAGAGAAGGVAQGPRVRYARRRGSSRSRGRRSAASPHGSRCSIARSSRLREASRRCTSAHGSLHRARRRRPPAWVMQNVRALGSPATLLLDHRLVERPPISRRPPRVELEHAPARGRSCTPPPAPGAQGPAAPEQPALGPAVRDLQPRLRHAVFERSGSERLAGARRAADVRLHVRRRRPGTRHCRRSASLCARALSDCAALHRRRSRGGHLRPAVRQRLQHAFNPGRRCGFRSARRSARWRSCWCRLPVERRCSRSGSR